MSPESDISKNTLNTLQQAMEYLIDKGFNARLHKDQLMIIYGKKSECSAGELVNYSHIIFVIKGQEHWIVAPPREGEYNLKPSAHNNLNEAISRVITIIMDFAT